jgi:hypothetical protein
MDSTQRRNEVQRVRARVRDGDVTVELRQIARGRWAATVETEEGPITVESDSIEDLHEYALAAARARRGHPSGSSEAPRNGYNERD